MFQEFDLYYEALIHTLDHSVTSSLLTQELSPSIINWLTNMTKSYTSYTHNWNEVNDLFEFEIKVSSVRKENSHEINMETMDHSEGMCLFVTFADAQLKARHIVGYDDDSLDDTYWLFADFFPRIALPVELYTGKVVCCGPCTRSRIVIESGEGLLNFVCVFLKTNSKRDVRL